MDKYELITKPIIIKNSGIWAIVWIILLSGFLMSRDITEAIDNQTDAIKDQTEQMMSIITT